VKKIFAKYKWLLIALLMISIIAVPMVVNTLFKFSSNFSAEWSAGDALSYVSGLQALLGTIILGIITVEQGQDAQEVNRRLSEENNGTKTFTCCEANKSIMQTDSASSWSAVVCATVQTV